MWIRLKNVKFYGYHGVDPFEREHGGPFEFDVEIRVERSIDSITDSLSDTLDYVEIGRVARQVCEEKKYQLIESLARALIEQLRLRFTCEEIIVRVRKPGAAVGIVLDTVEVELHWNK